MGIAGVFFDLDGTVLNTNDLVVESFRHTARHHLGRDLSPEEIYPTFGELLEETLSRWAPREKLPELLTTYRTFNLAEHDRYVTCFPGVHDLLRRLRAVNIRTGIVTSKLRESAHRGLDLVDLSPLFDVIVCAEDTERHKPDPAPLLRALSLSGVSPSESIMVGDSPGDLGCARAAGSLPVAVAWSVFPRERLLAEGAEAIISDWSELLALCETGAP